MRQKSRDFPQRLARNIRLFTFSSTSPPRLDLYLSPTFLMILLFHVHLSDLQGYEA
jgi:hypothetical protein